MSKKMPESRPPKRKYKLIGKITTPRISTRKSPDKRNTPRIIAPTACCSASCC